MAKQSLRRLFSFLLLAACTLMLIGVALIVLYNWTGRRAWEECRPKLETRGQPITLKALAPPPVPDDHNYAMTPFLAPLFRVDPAAPKLLPSGHDTEARRFAASLPDMPLEEWRLGRHPRLGKNLERIIEARGEAVIRANGVPVTSLADEKTAAHAILELLKPQETILNELQIASRRPHVRFNIAYDFEPPETMPLPHLPFQNKAACLFSIRAEAELALGRTEAAFSDLLAAFRMADALKNEPFLASAHVHASGVMRAMEPLWLGVNNQQWNDAQLKTIQEVLRKEDFLAELRQAFRADRTMTLATIEYYRNHPNNLLNLGDSPHPPTPDQSSLSKNTPAKKLANHITGALPSGWFYREMVSYNRIFEEKFLADTLSPPRRATVEQIKRHVAEVDEMRRAVWPTIKQHRVIAGIMVQPLKNAYLNSISTQTYVELALLACGIERYRLRHGRFPDQPEAMKPEFVDSLPADLITGEPLVYRLADDGQFVLYSVGWNASDDGGKPGITPGGRWAKTKGDWVWRGGPAQRKADVVESN
jgi:hypothetical protein